MGFVCLFPGILIHASTVVFQEILFGLLRSFLAFSMGFATNSEKDFPKKI